MDEIANNKRAKYRRVLGDERFLLILINPNLFSRHFPFSIRFLNFFLLIKSLESHLSVGIHQTRDTMRGGGRAFSSRGGHSGDRDYGSKFRGPGNSYRDGGSGGRFNQNRGNDRRFDDGFKGGSSNRSRSRYDRRSNDRFAHGHNDRSSRVKKLTKSHTIRKKETHIKNTLVNTKLIYFQIDPRDDSLARKRPRHEVSRTKRINEEFGAAFCGFSTKHKCCSKIGRFQLT